MKKSLLLVLGLGLAACTKEVPYQYEFKDEVLSKSAVGDLSRDRILTVSTGPMSRLTADGRPFSFGDNKRVRLEFTENSLKVIEKDSDARYASEINDKLLMEFPIESVDFQCSTDAFGECTGKEEQKKDVNELQMTQFKFKKDTPIVTTALEALPIMFDVQLGSPCYKETGSKITGYEVTPGAINIQVKKTFQQVCLSLENSLSDTSVSSIFHYSIVDVDSVLSKDFKRIPYDDSDEDTFGFFYTTKDLHDIDGNLSDKETVRTMNHWNPNRTTIDYHLSDEFKKPEHATLKALTYEAVKRLNDGLRESGAKFQITLHEPSGKNPGDIRNSMIVLVEDPTAAGLLGYGPQTEDPVSGEIISARTIMFLAGFEQYVRINYDEIGRVMKRQQTEALSKAQQKAEQPTDDSIAVDDGTGLTADLRVKGTNVKVDPAFANKIKTLKWAEKVRTAKTAKQVVKVKGNDITQAMPLSKIRNDIKNYTRNRSDEYGKRDLQSYMKYLREAKNCEFTSEGGSLPELRPGLTAKIKERFSNEAKTGLRPWTTLNKTEKKELIDIVMAEVWIPVVLHEMGHNMGLRHNFNGSEDTKNFYDMANKDDKLKLEKYGVQHQMPYSTIMEYGDDLRALTFLGKYDIAALRYGYARQVEVVVDGKTQIESLEGELNAQGNTTISIASLKEKLAAKKGELKDYGFCTDESVGPNAGCRRFDEGESYEKIAQYLINSYKDRYDARAKRNNRVNFSVLDDAGYLNARVNNLMDLRIFIELYDRIASMPSYPESAPIWTTEPFLKDIKAAAKLSAEFMIELLNTPELHCLVKNKTTGALAAVVPISDIGGGINCMGIELTSPYVVVGQTGKLFNSTKDPDSKNPYIDQIDVRGFYLDRMAAARVLFKRAMAPYSSHDESLNNIWDLELVRPQIEETLRTLLTNHVVRPQVFTMEDGSELKVVVPLDFHKSALVKKPLYKQMADGLGIRNSAVYFSEILGREATREATTAADNAQSGLQLKNFVGVRIAGEMDVAPTAKGLLSIDLGNGRKAFAGGSNIVAQELIVDLYINTALSETKPEVLTNLVAFITKKLQVPDPSTVILTEAELTAGVAGLSANEAKFLVQLSSLAGATGVLEKVDQLDSGNMLASGEIVKILESIPGI